MPQAFVYIAHVKGFYKVGIASNVARRMNGLRTANPNQLKLIFKVEVPAGMAAEVERRAHRLLAPHHHRGEWFKLCATRAEIIAAIYQAIEDAVVAEPDPRFFKAHRAALAFKAGMTRTRAKSNQKDISRPYDSLVRERSSVQS